MTRIPTYDAREAAQQAGEATRVVPTRIQTPVAQEARDIERAIPAALERKANADLDWQMRLLKIKEGNDLRNAANDLDSFLLERQTELGEISPTEWMGHMSKAGDAEIDRLTEKYSPGPGPIRDTMRARLETGLLRNLAKLQTEVMPAAFREAGVYLDGRRKELLLRAGSIDGIAAVVGSRDDPNTPEDESTGFEADLRQIQEQFGISDLMIETERRAFLSASVVSFIETWKAEHPVELEALLEEAASGETDVSADARAIQDFYTGGGSNENMNLGALQNKLAEVTRRADQELGNTASVTLQNHQTTLSSEYARWARGFDPVSTDNNAALRGEILRFIEAAPHMLLAVGDYENLMRGLVEMNPEVYEALSEDPDKLNDNIYYAGAVGLLVQAQRDTSIAGQFIKGVIMEITHEQVDEAEEQPTEEPGEVSGEVSDEGDVVVSPTFTVRPPPERPDPWDERVEAMHGLLWEED